MGIHEGQANRSTPRDFWVGSFEQERHKDQPVDFALLRIMPSCKLKELAACKLVASLFKLDSVLQGLAFVVVKR